MAPSLTVMSSEPDHRCDVLVVGGGPAGAAAATVLADGGSSVIVADKAVFPRDKCCGDGLTTLALRELELLGLDPATVPSMNPVGSAWLRSPGGREFEVPLPPDGVYAAVATRLDLDAALIDLAAERGAVVHQGVTASAVHRRADAIDVVVDGLGVVRANAVIAADGMWSPIRRMVGAGVEGYRGEWHAFRQYVEHVTGPAAERLIVWFEPDLLPGYAWSFPLPGGRANIGFGVLRDGRLSGRDLAETWRDLLRRDHVVEALGPGADPIGRHTAWPIPARIDGLPLSSGRVLFVGDAAAATDVLTGEGIGQALLTGRVAAESFLAGHDPAERAAQYETSVRHHLFADHRMSNRLGKVLASRRGADVALNIVEHSGSWGRRNFARWMFEDEPRAIALTPSRWHRSVLRRPGVWRDHRWSTADSEEPSTL